MTLAGAGHAQVEVASKRRRNALARGRRAAPVQLVRCLDQGEVVVVGLSRRTPGMGYVLRPGPDGRPVCPCPGYAWRGDCRHAQAAGMPPVVDTAGDGTRR